MRRSIYLAVFTLFMLLSAANINAQIKPENTLITGNSAGKVKLGMTVAEARKALNGLKLERTSDGEGVAPIAVSQGKETIMLFYAGEEDNSSKINESAIIEYIEVLSKDFQTSEGVKPGMKLSEVEKKYGKIRKVIVSEIESREFADFENQPKALQFRVDGENESAGNYKDGENKASEYTPNAYIFTIIIDGVNPFDEDFKPDQNAHFSSTYTNLSEDCTSTGGDDGGHVSTICKEIGAYKISYFDSAAALHFSVETSGEENSITLATQLLNYDTKIRKIEWRLANGKPFAVIMRINKFEVTDEGIPGKITGEYLIVKGLKYFEKIDFEVDAKKKNANEEARKLADGGYLKSVKSQVN